MGKRVVAVVVFLAATLVAPVGSPAHGGSNTPVVGDWPFCTSASQVGCIEFFSFEDATGTIREYASLAETQNAGVTVTARCQKGASADGDPCSPPKSIGCGSAGTRFQLSVEPTPFDNNAQPTDGASLLGRRFVARVRTGDYDPAFSMGGRIESTKRTVLDSGLFLFEVSGQIQQTYVVDSQSVAMMPVETYRSRLSAYLKTSKASSIRYGSAVSVFPSDFLNSTSVDLGGYCVAMPFTGAYADSNGGGFTTTWVPAKPTDAVASTIKFEVSGPHYLPDSNGADDKIVPARIRFFLPDQFFTDAGYKDPSAFDASRLLVTTLDGEKPTPTLTRKTGGVLVDFGITHFSAPDPVVSLYRFGMTPPASNTTGVTTTAPPAATTSPSATPSQTLAVAKGKSVTSARILSTSGLARPAGSKVALKVPTSSARYCRVVGTSVKGISAGTCRVTVTVTPKTGKAKSTTVSVVVR